MGIDMRRPLIAAIEAALDEINSSPPQKKHKGGAGRALLVGAGLVTAGRVAMSARGRGLLESLQDRLPTEAMPHMHEEDEPPDDDAEFDEPQAEEDEDFDDEPQGEEDEDFDEEAEEEPQAEEDEDVADEAEDEPQAEDEAEDVDEAAEDEPVAEEDGDEADEEPEPAPKRRSRSRATTKGRR